MRYFCFCIVFNLFLKSTFFELVRSFALLIRNDFTFTSIIDSNVLKAAGFCRSQVSKSFLFKTTQVP